MLIFSIIQGKTIFILILIFKKPHIKITKNKHNKTTKKKSQHFILKFIHSFNQKNININNKFRNYLQEHPF